MKVNVVHWKHLDENTWLEHILQKSLCSAEEWVFFFFFFLSDSVESQKANFSDSAGWLKHIVIYFVFLCTLLLPAPLLILNTWYVWVI